MAHVPWFVDEYGICCIFGESGFEALHVSGPLSRGLYGRCATPRPATKNYPFTTASYPWTPAADNTAQKEGGWLCLDLGLTRIPD